MRLRFGGSDPSGGPVEVEFKVTLDHVQCWVGGWVVFLDRDTLITWLAKPRRVLTKDEVTFEPADWGVIFSFAGRVQRTVLEPRALARLTSAISRDLPPVDTTGAFKTVRGAHAAAGRPS